MIRLAALLAGVLCLGTPAAAHVYDHLYGNGFDTPADAPGSDAEAARFLTQATFGPTPAEIARLRALGYREWLAQQLGMPATAARPVVEQVIAARTAGGQGIGQSQRLNRWFWTATYAPDQLRQRMAWALSQIFVVSDQSSSISQDYIPLTEYWDLLARDAFGTYRGLLGDVTWNPTMGRYLSHFRNQKAGSTTQPDENYAREVMQLFSVGLVQRNLDFSPVLDGQLVPLPTYDQTTISQTARVFTGFTYADAPTGSGPPNYSGANFYAGGVTSAAQYAPMACWGTELFPASGTGSSNMRHDIGAKTLLAGFTLPANQTCAQDVNLALDNIAGHMNVAPFIARQLIQRFVTSNPSPGYIQRVATVFEDNGLPDHERGDLGAVIQAILLDAEARTPGAASYGKLREPVLRLTALWRAWGAQAPAADAYGEVKMIGTLNFVNAFGQRPLSSPTVFNFYEPDYAQPGPIADAGLFAPEFQITNESTTYSLSNGLYAFSAQAYAGMGNPPSDRPLLDLSALATNAANPAAMVALANARMLGGGMSPNMQTTLGNMLAFMSGASANEKAWSLVYLVALSPEFAAQR